MIKSGYRKFDIDAIQANVIDTNGAGDIFAAGFLYGLSRGWSLDRCGKAGSILAGNIIEKTGARLDEDGWTKVNNMLQAI